MDEAEIWCHYGALSEFLDVFLLDGIINRYSTDQCSRLVTLFLYMVAELSALQQIVTALTGLDGLPAVIVECAVTTIYTCTPIRRSYHPAF